MVQLVENKTGCPAVWYAMVSKMPNGSDDPAQHRFALPECARAVPALEKGAPGELMAHVNAAAAGNFGGVGQRGG